MCAAVTQTTGLGEDNCAVVGQSDFRKRRLMPAPTFNIEAIVRLTASTGDFADTFGDANGDALFLKLVILLEMAVATQDFIGTLRNTSIEFDATQLFAVQMVNLTTVSDYSVIVANQNDDDKTDQLSDGAFAGIVIGVVVAAALILAALWYICNRQNRDTTKHVKPAAKDGANNDHQYAVAASGNREETV